MLALRNWLCDVFRNQQECTECNAIVETETLTSNSMVCSGIQDCKEAYSEEE